MDCPSCDHHIRIKDIEDTAIFRKNDRDDFVADIECPHCHEIMAAQMQTVLIPYRLHRREFD